MNELLSGKTLDIYLSDIKRIFKTFDFDRLKKMIFMNTDSFFSFIGNESETLSGKSFKEIIDAIEPFIPLVISEDSLDAYLLTAVSQDDEALDLLQNQLIQNAKIRFVKNVVNAQSDEDLEEIFDICRTIREYKEKSTVV